MRYPKVLIGAPIYDQKEYCREAWVKNVEQINYPNFDWCLVDNSKKSRYFRELKEKHPGHIYRSPRGNNSRDGVAYSCNVLRKKVLDEGYDYLLMVESDLFPPKDVVHRLLRHGRPVVGLPYEIGTDKVRGLCIFVPEMRSNGLLATRRLKKEEEPAFMDGSLQRVHGMGVGCVLIHKDILEEFPFWYSSLDDERMKGKVVRKHPDVYFYLQLHNNHIKVFCDTSVLVYHDNSDWNDVADV